MHTTFSPLPRRRLPSGGSAFTLIELLVVISIIAVLAGLLLPVVSRVMENARKVAAKSTETQIVTAVNSYMTEYGQYPVDSSLLTAGTNGGSLDYTYGTDDHNYMLLEVLRAFPNAATDPTTSTFLALNTRRVVYFEGKNVKNNTVPKDGFILVVGAKSSNQNKTSFKLGDLIDPWGNVYFVRLDTGYSNAVLNPYKDKSTSSGDDSGAVPGDILSTGVVAYSYGLDTVPGSTSVAPTSPYTAIGDDVVSWQ